MTFHQSLPSFSRRHNGRFLAKNQLLVLALLLIALFFLAGCAETGQMESQPRYNPLAASNLFPNGQSAQLPVPGTVPYSSTVSPNSPATTGQTDTGEPIKGWPMTVTKEMVQLGQDRYNIFCIPCHGPNGEGDGRAVGFGFPKPPNLLEQNAKSLANGDIFQIIQNGRGKMFSYGYRVKPDERWAIVAYIRALQLKNGAVTPQELTPDQLDQIGKQQ
jgi:mono/diheme cytochrome c family protein